jgi:Cytidylyltransferase-like
MADPLDQLYSDRVSWVLWTTDGRIQTAEPPRALLPGSFNPLHLGHTTLADVAAARLGRPVAFELSVTNVDKPELPPDEVLRRLEQFRSRHPVYVTRAATFREKAALFPGCVFVVGADTAVRVIDPRFYSGDPAAMLRGLDEIRAANCRFFVAGRVDSGGRFVEVGGVAVPNGYRDLFEGPAEREFRVDVSSTELRSKGIG